MIKNIKNIDVIEKIFIVIDWEIINFWEFFGVFFIIFLLGGFVVKVNVVKVFIIKFIYNSWIIVNGRLILINGFNKVIL